MQCATMPSGNNHSLLSKVKAKCGGNHSSHSVSELMNAVLTEDNELSLQTKALPHTFEEAFKCVIEKWAESNMCGLREYLVSQSVHSALSMADRIKVVCSKDFDEIWKICKKCFKWYDGHLFFLPLLTKKFHYIGNSCSEAQAQLGIQVNRMGRILVSYMKYAKRMVHCQDKDGSPMVIFKLDSEYDKIPDFHAERLKALIRKVLKMKNESPRVKIEFSTIEAAQERFHQSSHSDNRVEHCSSEADSLRGLPPDRKLFTTSYPDPINCT